MWPMWQHWPKLQTSFQSWKRRPRFFKFFVPFLFIKRHQKITQAKVFEKIASWQHALLFIKPKPFIIPSQARDFAEECPSTKSCKNWSPWNFYMFNRFVDLFQLNDEWIHVTKIKRLFSTSELNIATGETSQAITPFHFFDNFNFHH